MITDGELDELDFEWFGSWIDVGPSEFDQLRSDRSRLKYAMEKIDGFRQALGPLIRTAP